jgi:copper chaperone CopZ
MQKIIKIKGMTCGHCERRVQKNLKGICGVTSADVSATDKKSYCRINL